MRFQQKQAMQEKTFPDESFISCLCCIPRTWTLFANDQWTRIFESHDDGLELIKEFLRIRGAPSVEPVSFLDKISLWLNEAIWNDEFDHLVIVAPAPTLKKINHVLSPDVLGRTIAEVNWPAVVAARNNSRKDKSLFPSERDKNQ